ncbi:hypothetical protein NPIL_17861 [Nephila pilipes]|uniref:Uncharacterized protein n=1 Tax=Nephila pilipes TaxID=299642 RepID=A0A8X6TIZ9_NEPPI|nr:hypothetical protein NPIL_3921 [Nephila pilipes]GFU22850.1 hypothetical protein NPIL_17861 [Nephila pilipes]
MTKFEVSKVVSLSGADRARPQCIVFFLVIIRRTERSYRRKEFCKELVPFPQLQCGREEKIVSDIQDKRLQKGKEIAGSGHGEVDTKSRCSHTSVHAQPPVYSVPYSLVCYYVMHQQIFISTWNTRRIVSRLVRNA